MTDNSGNGISGTPAGWYPDAQGTQRWWDGSAWTDHVQEPTVAAPAPPPPPRTAHSLDPKAEAKAAKASRPWFKKKRWWVVGAVLALFIIGAASGGGSSDSTKPAAANTTPKSQPTHKPAKTKPSPTPTKTTPSATPTPTKPPAPVAMQVGAGQIVHEFEQNELAADQKYKGKTLRITGLVTKIDTELFNGDKYYVELAKSKYDFLSVSCHDMSNAELATLKVGQTATVIGDFDDGGDLGVDVKNCSLPS